MQHAKKIVLVDPNPMARIGGLNSDLDEAVSEILGRKGITDDRKLSLYQDALYRYQKRVASARRPLQLALTTPYDTGSVIESYKNSDKEKVKFALRRIELSPYLSWSDDGELIHHGTRIAGSNIKDLLDLFVSEREKVPGWNEFSNAMKETFIEPESSKSKRTERRTPLKKEHSSIKRDGESDLRRSKRPKKKKEAGIGFRWDPY